MAATVEGAAVTGAAVSVTVADPSEPPQAASVSPANTVDAATQRRVDVVERVERLIERGVIAGHSDTTGSSAPSRDRPRVTPLQHCTRLHRAASANCPGGGTVRKVGRLTSEMRPSHRLFDSPITHWPPLTLNGTHDAK